MANPANEPIKLGIYESRQAYDDQPIIYNSFSGVDIVAQIILPNEPRAMTLGELQTFSYSTHRESKPIRLVGRTNVRGFLRGPRTIAGSMIFTVFNTYAFYRLEQYKHLVMGSSQNNFPMFPLADMLPPFDLVLTFSNEYGSFARMKIMDMVIIDEGGTMSVEDMVSEQTFTWMAGGIQPLTSYIPDALVEKQQLAYGAGPNPLLSGVNRLAFQ